MLFSRPLIEGKYLPIIWFVTSYHLKIALKIRNNSKFTIEQEMFANSTIDGVQHQFYKS